MDNPREIELYETKLRVYRNGDIWRLCKVSNQFGKKGDWVLSSGCLVGRNREYLQININSKGILMHRIVAYAYLGLDINNKKDQIDHENHITTDNRVENLRIVDNQKNAFNTNAKGCYLNKISNKWYSRINVNGQRKHLGIFDTYEEAHQAYLQAKLIYHII
jgi:hypothetical protein